MAALKHPRRGRPARGPLCLSQAGPALLLLVLAATWSCGPSAPPLRHRGHHRDATHVAQGPLAGACALAALFPVVDLTPAGLDGVAARVVTVDVAGARAKLRARFPDGAPAGLTRVTVEAPRPRLAVVIDDLGLREAQLGPLWRLGQPLTYAILPKHRWSGADEAFLRGRGASVLVHVPMESVYPSQMTIGGYLRRDQTPTERRTLWDQSLAAVPSAVGFNNHQGSALTPRGDLLMPLLSGLAADYIVLDSRTTPDTKLATLGQVLGHPTAARDVFLDNRRDPQAGVVQLEEALDLARRRGHAVIIGHPYPETVEALRRFLERHSDEVHLVGIERVTEPPVTPWWRRSCGAPPP